MSIRFCNPSKARWNENDFAPLMHTLEGCKKAEPKQPWIHLKFSLVGASLFSLNMSEKRDPTRGVNVERSTFCILCLHCPFFILPCSCHQDTEVRVTRVTQKWFFQSAYLETMAKQCNIDSPPDQKALQGSFCWGSKAHLRQQWGCDVTFLVVSIEKNPSCWQDRVCSKPKGGWSSNKRVNSQLPDYSKEQEYPWMKTNE